MSHIVCGDGMDAVVSSGALLIIDPPYNETQLYGAGVGCTNKLVFADGFRAGDAIRYHGAPTWVFAWDCVTSWYTPNRPLKRMKLCLWYGDITKYNPNGFLFGDRFDKPRIVRNTRGEHLAMPKNGKTLSDVYSHPITQHRKQENSFNQSKPFDWACSLVANTIGDSTIIIDLFAGSGVFGCVAKHLNVDYVGFELDEARANNARKNIEDFSLKMKPGMSDMFDEQL